MIKKVMVFGTFDILHPGHLSFFKQAQKYGQLTVVVARDKNVLKIKGKLPQNSENERLKTVKNIWGITALLGDLNDPYKVIKKAGPGIICLGYDQKSFVNELKFKFPKIKIIRLKPYKPELFKTSKLIQYARH
ncbi:FAD synthase [Candidatus Parcubacteria bacterium]|nr:MAG: FAD synthase [Candidatus Parcubacteria bacterium]